MELREYHLNLRGMSGRVVRFRILDVEEIERIEDNAARDAGEDASAQQLRRAQLRLLVAAMLHSYTEPGQEPARVQKAGSLVIDGGKADTEKLKGAAWKTVENGGALLAMNFGSLFNAKELSALTMLYRDHHELNVAEVEMLMGKGSPVSSGD